MIFLIIDRNFKNQEGISLVEVIIYIFILSLVLGIMVQSFISLNSVYRNIKLERELQSSGFNIVENINREIKLATSVNFEQSLFATTAGKIVLLGKEVDESDYEIIFDLNMGNIRYNKNSEEYLSLNSNKTIIESLVFYYLVNSNSKAIKTELVIRATDRNVVKIKKFYGFSVLRNSY